MLLAAALLACQPQPLGYPGDSETNLAVELTANPASQVTPLACSPTGVEADAFTFSWTVDGDAFAGLTLRGEHDGDTVFPGYTREGQTWACTIEAWRDGESVGSATAATEVQPTALPDLDPYVAPVAWASDDAVYYTGTLAGASALKLTWGVDGWLDRRAPAGANYVAYDTNEIRAENYAPMQREGEHWVAAITPTDGSRAVHMVFEGDGQTDDNDGFEHTWDVVFPSVGPYLTWNEVAVPHDGIVVNWATGQPGLGIVEYGPDTENVAYAVGTEVGLVHHVAVTGLPAGQVFRYRVRDAADRTSPWSTFRTASPEDREFTFLVAADMQDTGRPDDRWPELAERMAVDWPDARFLLVPGDLAADDHPGLWWAFFNSGRALFNHLPLVPTVGNHDTPGVPSSADSTSWRHWFALPATPGSETYWRLDYGKTRIFAINSEIPSELDTDGSQFGWLEEETLDLWDGNEREVDWAIAAFHVPAYTAGARFASTAAAQRPITQLFDGAVDAVITGHEHIYQRFHPITYDGTLAPSGEYGLGPDDGPLYLVAPSAGFGYLDVRMVESEEPGGEQRALLAWPELVDEQGIVDPIHGFLVAEVTATSLSFDFVGMGDTSDPTEPTVWDSVVLGK